MKKLLTFALAFALTLSVSATVFAADINQDTDPKSGNTEVSFNVDPAYTVTIPETVKLDKVDNNGVITYEKTANITANAGVRLCENEQIQVTIAGDFELKTSDTAAYVLPYTVTAGAKPISSEDVVANFGTSLAAQSSILHFAAENPKYAGEYKDTVVFTIAIINN